jgi:hypothetical protein
MHDTANTSAFKKSDRHYENDVIIRERERERERKTIMP